jgi:hypothetical protein
VLLLNTLIVWPYFKEKGFNRMHIITYVFNRNNDILLTNFVNQYDFFKVDLISLFFASH